MRSLIPLLSFALAARASPVSPESWSRKRATLTECLDAAEVPYVDADSPKWETAILPHNLRVPITPAAIAYATTIEHIQSGVNCAVESGVKVSPKSGGHSYGSYGLGGEDGHLVIQLDRMYGVELLEDNSAIISAGTRLGYAALQLDEQGSRAISHGTCPSVGIGGHAIHGGFGFSSHTHGLALDGIIGANIVLANGSLIHASAIENSDAFWAIRGAGSSFGIVAEFEFETFAQPEEVGWFKINSKLVSRGRDAMVTSLGQFQQIIADGGMDSNLNMRLGPSVDGTVLEAVYHGRPEDGRQALEPFSDILALDWTSNKTQISRGTWLEMIQDWTYGDPLDITSNYTAHDNAYTSNLVTKHLPETALTAFVDYWLEVGLREDAEPWWLQMDIHGDPAGAIGKVAQDASSYAHRDKLWLFQISSPLALAPEAGPGIEFVKGFMNSLTDNLEDEEWGRYINYLDTELSRDDAQVQYWAGHLERLREIKAALDPTEVFFNPQSVQPAF